MSSPSDTGSDTGGGDAPYAGPRIADGAESDMVTSHAMRSHPALWQVQDFVDDTPPPVNPVQVVLRLLRGRWLMLSVSAPLVGLVLGVLVYLSLSAVYQSQGLVRPVAKEQKILYADNDDSRLRLYDAFVSSEATYLQSQRVLVRAHELLVDRMAARSETEVPPSFKDLADAINVKKLKGLIAVHAVSADPSRAQMMVNAVLDGYLDLQARQSDTRQTLRARELEARVQELQTKQSALARALLDVGEEYDTSSLAKAHLTKVTQLEELSARIDELTNSLVEMEASNGALDADTGDMEIKRATLLDRAMADMVFERAKRAADLEKLLLRYQPTHPKVATLATSLQVIDDAIETRRRLIATLGKTGAITGTDGASKTQSMDELRALKKKLTGRQRDLSAEARVLNGKLIQLRRINAEQAQVTGMLAETRRILDQVLLESRNSLPGIIEILSRGSTPDMPHQDKRKQFAILAALAGSGAVVVAVLLLRLFSPHLRYSDDLDTAMIAAPVTVMGSVPERRDAAAFLSDLQLHPDWQHGRCNVVAVARFSDCCVIPLDMIAGEAVRQGLRTLVVCAAPDGSSSGAGFIDAVQGGADPETLPDMDFDYIGYGVRSSDTGFSVQAARLWLQSLAGRYDIILIYTGISEVHYSTRILPTLADIAVAAVTAGDEKRRIQRLCSQTPRTVFLFTGAEAGDPGLDHAHRTTTPPQEGDCHDQAA